MEDWEERIEIDEENLGGKPVIRGTGVAVHVLVGALAEDESMEAVQKRYGISREDMLAALAYATDTVADEVVHLLPHRKSKQATFHGWQHGIEVDEGILRGKPVIKGTRVPVYVLVGSLAGGDSAEIVSEAYGVSEEDVRAALSYAAESVAEEVVRALPDR